MPDKPFIWYTEPHESEPCSRCKFRRYDSFHDESWCGHENKPHGIGNSRLVDRWGHCDQWEQDEIFKED